MIPKHVFTLQHSLRGSFVLGSLITSSILILGVGAPAFTNIDPQTVQVSNRFASPTFEHPFGTDNLGRDIWSRVLYGTRLTLEISISSVVLASVFGVSVGALTSYYGGWIDNVTMRVVDALLAFPTIIIALLLRLILGAGLGSMILTLGIVYTVVITRTVRGAVLSEREKTYILATYAIGSNTFRIVFKHILPNIIPPILVLATTLFADAIIVESSLSFIGIGVSTLEPSWGTMLRDSMEFMQEYPHVAIFPGLTISLTVLGINLVGDGLQDMLAPQQIGEL